jgi:ribonuclease HII
LAGPVYAAAVVLPTDCEINGLRDSKKLSPIKRDRLYSIINGTALAIGIGVVDWTEIDGINILAATLKAMKLAVDNLRDKDGNTFIPKTILIDGNRAPNLTLKTVTVIDGDNLCASVAAASVIAKVERDRYMVKAAELYPGYGFEKHKGYGTKEHIASIGRLGLCPIHRRSFIKDSWLNGL